jgi:hypothetical protein
MDRPFGGRQVLACSHSARETAANEAALSLKKTRKIVETCRGIGTIAPKRLRVDRTF